MIFPLLLTVLMLLVIVMDASRYLIPNWLVGMVLALWGVFFALHPEAVHWQHALIAAGSMFMAGMIIFALRVMGGGDVKLLAACCLWTGLKALPDFLVITALLGGVLTIFLLLIRWLLKKRSNLPRILQSGAPVPYGLAIAAAFLWLLWRGQLPGIAVLG